jgi:hypothetical protein
MKFSWPAGLFGIAASFRKPSFMTGQPSYEPAIIVIDRGVKACAIVDAGRIRVELVDALFEKRIQIGPLIVTNIDVVKWYNGVPNDYEIAMSPGVPPGPLRA